MSDSEKGRNPKYPCSEEQVCSRCAGGDEPELSSLLMKALEKINFLTTKITVLEETSVGLGATLLDLAN